MATEEFTAAQLAEHTGLAPGTLRVWETRYGFPTPQRLPGNRKRYSAVDIAQVTAVLAHRQAGLSLPAAIQRVRSGEPERPLSMFAALREKRPDLAVRIFSKRALIALSRAVEDEHAARGTGGVLLGSFQRERHYRASERRWCQLARSAELTVVMADFDRLTDAGSGPVEVPVAAAQALEREWTVVVHSPTASACLAAWEVPSPHPMPELDRPFELIWSCDPSAAHTAVLAASTVLSAAAPQVAARLPPAVLETPAPTLPNLRFSDDLTARAFAYLAEVPASPGSLTGAGR